VSEDQNNLDDKKKAANEKRKKSLSKRRRTRVSVPEFVEFENTEQPKKEKIFIDPNWKYSDLPPIGQRMLQLEIANPDITGQELKRLLNTKISHTSFYKIRNSKLYQALLAEARKDEWTLLKELRLEALKKMRSFLRSEDKNLSFRAASILIKNGMMIELMQKKIELDKQAQAEVFNNPIKKVIEFKFEDKQFPILGKTILKEDGSIEYIDQTNGIVAKKDANSNEIEVVYKKVNETNEQENNSNVSNTNNEQEKENEEIKISLNMESLLNDDDDRE
jgi:hypothetical protein